MKLKYIMLFSWLVFWREFSIVFAAFLVPFFILAAIVVKPHKTILQPVAFVTKLKGIKNVFSVVRKDYDEKTAIRLGKYFNV